MKFVLVIPARGGSKRIPLKNIKDLAGKPLIMHTVDYALKFFSPEDIYVSTDSPEIKQVVEASGVQIIDRPAELSGDYTTTAAVLQHASQVIKSRGVDYDYMVLLQCTNPCRPINMMTDCMKIITDNNYTCLVGVTRSWNKFGKIQNNCYVPWNYKFGQRSQDLEPLYFENGLVYITCRSLIEGGGIIDEHPYPYEIDSKYGLVDIDTYEDFEFAQFKIMKMAQEETASLLPTE